MSYGFSNYSVLVPLLKQKMTSSCLSFLAAAAVMYAWPCARIFTYIKVDSVRTHVPFTLWLDISIMEGLIAKEKKKGREPAPSVKLFNCVSTYEVLSLHCALKFMAIDDWLHSSSSCYSQPFESNPAA